LPRHGGSFARHSTRDIEVAEQRLPNRFHRSANSSSSSIHLFALCTAYSTDSSTRNVLSVSLGTGGWRSSNLDKLRSFMVMADDNKQQQQPGATNSTAGSSTAAAATTPAGMDGVNHNAPVNMAEYKKSQARVRELIEKRRLLEKRLVRITILLPP
jgi:hypothetical protein